MFRQIHKFCFILLLLTSSVSADDRVTTWLSQMGCDKLLTIYLEDQLQTGSSSEKTQAAKSLAELYSRILSKSADGKETKILQKANALLESVPQVGNDDLRLQLVRASYLAGELLLDKYRLRYVDKEKADEAVVQLQTTATKLKQIRNKYSRRARTSKNFDEQDSNRLGLATSLLAWSTYYIAWHTDDKLLAQEGADLFASMLDSEEASLQFVALDLRSEEYGARAILGIALCKDIIALADTTNVWLDELDHNETWGEIRRQLPMWKFILAINNKRWDEVTATLNENRATTLSQMLRLAAVHAMEETSNLQADAVAVLAIEILIEQAELGVVSDIVERFGDKGLPSDGFIAQYLQGDIEYRKLRGEYSGDIPPKEASLRNKFKTVSEILKNALTTPDAKKYFTIKDECQYLLGLSQFYAGEFHAASKTFQEIGERTSSERSLWMAIVALDQLKSPSDSSRQLKTKLMAHYVSLWPTSHKSTQLKLQIPSDEATRSSIEELLAIQSSDPNFSNAQRQASRLLYEQWGAAQAGEYSTIGNKYIGVVLPIMFEDAEMTNDNTVLERAAVRALRILEVSLHHEVNRIIAAQRAYETLNSLGEQIDLTRYQTEIDYRSLVKSLLAQDPDNAHILVNQMIQTYPNDAWTNRACISLWNWWSETNNFNARDSFCVGNYLLNSIEEQEISSPRYIGIAQQTAKSAFELYVSENDEQAGADALRISKILIRAYPKSKDILQLSAPIEEVLGDKTLAKKYWKTVTSGSSKGGEDWLEARFNYITLVSNDDPATALAMLNQHVALYPTYGVNPYGSLLERLHQKLKEQSNES